MKEQLQFRIEIIYVNFLQILWIDFGLQDASYIHLVAAAVGECASAIVR